MKKRLLVFLGVILAISLFGGGYFLWGKGQVISYLPRDEKVDRLSRNLNLTLGEVDCRPAEDLFKQAADCNYCVNTLKVECPDCCLQFGPVRAVKCTKEADPKYQCNPLAFPSGSCPGAGLDNQRIGCGDLASSPGHDGDCTKTPGEQKWLCDEDNLSPSSRGCTPAADAAAKGCGDCRGVSPYYDIEEVTISTKDPKTGETETETKYEYTPSSDYRTEYNKCIAYTDSLSQCTNGYTDCKENVCGTGESFDAHCLNSPSPNGQKGSCDQRVAWPRCDTLTATTCAGFANQATECLTSASGACHGCFIQLGGEDFFYRFVARSREKITIMWQINSTPITNEYATRYFYSMVQVIDETTDRVVHESLVNQKSFEGSFSLFSATALSAVERGNTVLETGKPYRVRIYYFIPPLGLNLRIQINEVQIIAVRTRY